MKILRSLSVGLVSAFLFTAGANAANFSFTGNLSNDDEVQLFNFTVGASSTVQLRTYSYAGGTMADGTVIAAGGFDPILTLFDDTGTFIDFNDDGDIVPIDPLTDAAFDTFLEVLLGAGDYIVAVSQFSNFSFGDLDDGFEGSGTSNFEDVTGDFRTSAWAFDILNVDSGSVGGTVNPVPVPAALPLLATGLIGLGIFRLRQRRRGAEV